VNAEDILFYANKHVLDALQDFPDDQWDASGVTGWWSMKHVLGHLTAFETLLVAALESFGRQPSAYLQKYLDLGGHEFNNQAVPPLAQKPLAELWGQYHAAHARSLELLRLIPLEKRRQAGTLPWYGAEYDLEDFIAYTYYGHKREHMGEINAFRDRLRNAA